jgi:hypothetical protein
LNQYQQKILEVLLLDIERVRLSLSLDFDVCLKEIEIIELSILTNEHEFQDVMMSYDISKEQITLQHRLILGKLTKLEEKCNKLINFKEAGLINQKCQIEIESRCSFTLGISNSLKQNWNEAILLFTKAVELDISQAEFMLSYILQICRKINIKDLSYVKISVYYVNEIRLILTCCLGIQRSENFSALSDKIQTIVHSLIGNILHDLVTQLQHHYTVC